jgi:hypothetical protein
MCSKAVKEIAAQRGTTTGRILSDLVRKTLETLPREEIRNGAPLGPVRPSGYPPLTLAVVNGLRDES